MSEDSSILAAGRDVGVRKWWALGAVSLSILTVSLDSTVLSVALPTLARSLHASESYLEWFASGYLLTLAAATLPAGMVGDRYGRKKVLLVSLVLFGGGSALCAYSTTPAVFLTARLAMGVAGAGITVMALSALTVLFTDEERPRAVGIYASMNFLALPAGPILGGWMLSRFWWGWVFLLNVPVVLIGVTVCFLLVPESREPQARRIDTVGIAASAAGLVAVTYGLVDAGEHGWGHAAALAPIALGAVLLAGFFLWERRLGVRGGHPLVDPSLFTSRMFTWGAILSGVAGLTMVGVLFIMPQYFQSVRGTDTLGSGLRMLPLVGGLVVGAVPAGALVRALGAKTVITAGFVLVAAGAALGATTGRETGFLLVAVWMAVLCAGTGVVLTATTATALSRLTVDHSGIGSAVVQAFQKVSAPLGTAVMGSALAAAYQQHLHLAGLPAQAVTAAQASVNGGVEAAQLLHSTALREQVQEAFTHGLRVSLWVGAAMAAAGLVLTLVFLPGRPQARQDAEAATEAGPPLPRVGPDASATSRGR